MIRPRGRHVRRRRLNFSLLHWPYNCLSSPRSPSQDIFRMQRGKWNRTSFHKQCLTLNTSHYFLSPAIAETRSVSARTLLLELHGQTSRPGIIQTLARDHLCSRAYDKSHQPRFIKSSANLLLKSLPAACRTLFRNSSRLCQVAT